MPAQSKKPSILETLRSIGIAFSLGAIGGAIFFFLHLPLPWTLGSLTAAAIVSASGKDRWLMPRPARTLARPVIGVLAGSAFTPEIVATMGQWWLGIVIALVLSVCSTLLGWMFFRKVCGFDKVTAFFSSTPGGLSEMTFIGGSLGGDMRKIVLVQAVRIIFVVMFIPLALQLLIGHGFPRILPFSQAGMGMGLEDAALLVSCGVAGYIMGRYTPIPAGAMIAAMLCSAAVHAGGLTVAAPPDWLVVLVQIMVGSVAGSRFLGVTWRDVRTTVTMALLWAAILVGLSFGIAEIAAALVGQPFTVMLLAIAPGGLTEMTVVSFSLGLETAFVVTCQVCRSLFVVAVAPFIFRLVAGHGPPR